jgi:drug/metabolite transporter (DMT)-like permease
VTVVIYSLYPAVTILLARVLSHERLTMVGIAGLGLAAGSVGLIAASGVGPAVQVVRPVTQTDTWVGSKA